MAARTIAIAILTTIEAEPMSDHVLAAWIAEQVQARIPGKVGRFEVHPDPSAVFPPMSEEERGTNYGPCPNCDKASVVDDGGNCLHCGTPRGV